MADTHITNLPLGGLDEEAALRTILEGTANETGERFFAALVENLAKALKTHGAWVTEYLQERRRLRALAFWMDGQWIQNYEVDIAGTPCEQVIDTANLVHFPDNLLELYPNDPDITETGAVSYLGMPLKGRRENFGASGGHRQTPDTGRAESAGAFQDLCRASDRGNAKAAC